MDFFQVLIDFFQSLSGAASFIALAISILSLSNLWRKNPNISIRILGHQSDNLTALEHFFNILIINHSSQPTSIIDIRLVHLDPSKNRMLFWKCSSGNLPYHIAPFDCWKALLPFFQQSCFSSFRKADRKKLSRLYSSSSKAKWYAVIETPLVTHNIPIYFTKEE